MDLVLQQSAALLRWVESVEWKLRQAQREAVNFFLASNEGLDPRRLSSP